MKFLTWIEIKFGLSDRSKGWLVKRKIKKIEFVEKYKALCESMFKDGTSHPEYKTTEGLHLVGLARKELKYADTTYGGDILWGLYMTYRDLYANTKK